MNDNTTTQNDKSDLTRAIVRRMIQVLISYFITALLLFLSAWTLRWVWAWAYLGAGLLILAVNLLFVLPKRPEMIAERGKYEKEDIKSWDRVLTRIILVPTFAVFIVAGLDEHFNWSPDLSPAVHVAGLVFFLLGQLLWSWSMASNEFFSGSVRIQFDRGHTVASAGPYRFVRHPGYFGYIVYWFVGCLALGSLWTLIPAGMVAILFVVRTALEDKTLREELPGYEEYARQVRYRLLPGIW